MRVLIIEPDRQTANTIAAILMTAKIDVAQAVDGHEGFERAAQPGFDLITTEISLPDIDVIDMLEQIRKQGVETPVLAISERDDISTKVRFLGRGGDDFLSKPFHREELLARVQALVRRARGPRARTVKTGKLVVDLNDGTVTSDGEPVHLATRERKMLVMMSEAKGSTLTKEQINLDLYGHAADEHPLINIDRYITVLRKKLADATGGENCIETVWGRGYRLIEPLAQTA